MELDDKFFNIENYEFKFFLEGEEIPIKAARIQIGKKFSFSVDIPPADFDFKPLSWGVLVFRENEEDWKVACSGFYNGHGISKNLSSKKYNLKFVSLKYIYETIRFLDLTAEGTNAPYALLNKAFIGDTSTHMNDLENAETLRANIMTVLVSRLGGGGEDVDEADLGGFIEWILDPYVNNEFSQKHLSAFNFSERFAKVIENTNLNKIFAKHVQRFSQSLLQNKNPSLVLDKILQKIIGVFRYDLHHIPSGLKDGEEILIKPQMHLGIPPACNILFPHETYSYNFNRDYQNIPTRFRLHTFIGEEDIGRYFFSPDELNFFDEFESGREDGNETAEMFRGYIGGGEEEEAREIDESDMDDYIFLTEEEKFRNIIPSERNHQIMELMPTGIFKTMKEDEEGEVDIDETDIENESKITDYMFYEERYKNIMTNINMKLRFDLLPGLPGAILDQPNSLVGHINSVSHFIDLESPTGGTSVSMNFLKKDNINTPIVAGWYDDEMFKAGAISDFFEDLGTGTYYNKLEEVNSEDIETDGKNEKHYWINLKESLDELYDYYKGYPQISEKEYFSREKATAHEFLEKMGLGFEDEEIIVTDEDNNPFNIEVQGTEVSKERKEAVKEYMDNLRKESTYGYNE